MALTLICNQTVPFRDQDNDIKQKKQKQLSNYHDKSLNFNYFFFPLSTYLKQEDLVLKRTCVCLVMARSLETWTHINGGFIQVA